MFKKNLQIMCKKVIISLLLSYCRSDSRVAARIIFFYDIRIKYQRVSNLVNAYDAEIK